VVAGWLCRGQDGSCGYKVVAVSTRWEQGRCRLVAGVLGEGGRVAG